MKSKLGFQELLILHQKLPRTGDISRTSRVFAAFCNITDIPTESKEKSQIVL
jgi:hypothetical protein